MNPIIIVGLINLIASGLVLFATPFSSQSNRDKLFTLYEVSVAGLYGVYQLKQSSSRDSSDDSKSRDDHEV